MPKKATKIEKLTYEEALEKLEDIINKMEREELTLKESLDSFQEGMLLNEYCRSLLTEAELRIEELQQNGKLKEYDM